MIIDVIIHISSSSEINKDLSSGWIDLPVGARPSNPLVFLDDSVVREIHAERFPADGNSVHYDVEIEWGE